MGVVPACIQGMSYCGVYVTEGTSERAGVAKAAVILFVPDRKPCLSRHTVKVTQDSRPALRRRRRLATVNNQAYVYHVVYRRDTFRSLGAMIKNKQTKSAVYEWYWRFENGRVDDDVGRRNLHRIPGNPKKNIIE
ncbi:hypothetical protein LAZ67_6002800 [Cordylochernes scorpioides]|uniref:Uncharacterized protein n=1 Tax=Cordylochernes scorpioides TaxID=51811 RepID=A0ABY6KKG3_9ARAC|nr:hypothetical protein LAZ67_6002800 [Cordylochernes scorpioides]